MEGGTQDVYNWQQYLLAGVTLKISCVKESIQCIAVAINTTCNHSHSNEIHFHNQILMKFGWTFYI